LAASQHAGLCSISGQCLRESWWTKWHRDRFFSEYHSTNTSYSSSAMSCSYQKDKRAKPGNLPKRNGLPEIREHGIEKYFQISLAFQVSKPLNIRNVHKRDATAQEKYTVTSTIQLSKIRCLFVSDWNLERPCSWVGGKASRSHWTSCRGWQGGHSFHALPPRIQCRYNAMRHSHQRPHHSRLESGEPQVCSFVTVSQRHLLSAWHLRYWNKHWQFTCLSAGKVLSIHRSQDNAS